MTELDQLTAIRSLLESLFDPVGFGWGFGVGLTFCAPYLIVALLRMVFSERDE